MTHAPFGHRFAPSIRYASHARRMSALGIDSLWWTVIVLFVPLGPSTDELLAQPESLLATILLWTLLAQCMPIVLTGVMWVVWGTSPGKRALHLRIVDADSGQRMTAKQAALRTVGYLICFAACGAGFLPIPFNERRQGWHDRMANTIVIEEETGDGGRDA
jgi:uncharacterized RDD family membrane protein YckC